MTAYRQKTDVAALVLLLAAGALALTEAESLTAQAERVATVMDGLGASGAIVVAHGAMAGMAMRLALRRPDLVGGIVSLEGGGVGMIVRSSMIACTISTSSPV